MKNFTALLLVFSILTLTACGNTKIIEGKEYDTRGLVHKFMDEVPNNINSYSKNKGSLKFWLSLHKERLKQLLNREINLEEFKREFFE